jgi:hypothetical protein
LRDREFPFFGYGGCLTFAVDYVNTIVKPWKEVEQTFPSEMLPLHASELKPDRLTNTNFEALNGFFTNNVFGRFAAVCTDKTINSRPEVLTMQCMVIAVHLRILEILRTLLNHSLVFTEIFMFVEQSERTKQKSIEYFSQMVLQSESHKIPIHRYFMTKVHNEPGLVVADFIAHTAGTTVRSKHKGKVSQYLARLDFKSVFTPKDGRWASFEEVNEVK